MFVLQKRLSNVEDDRYSKLFQVTQNVTETLPIDQAYRRFWYDDFRFTLSVLDPFARQCHILLDDLDSSTGTQVLHQQVKYLRLFIKLLYRCVI